MNVKKIRLPYVNNLSAILITLAINLGIVFLFNWPEGITYTGALWDSLFCTTITLVIDLPIVYISMKKKRAAGALPTQVPISRLMQRLPKNPVALGAILLVVFAVLTVGLNALVLWFFGMKSMTFFSWMAYKLLYATLLSVKLTEVIIFRYIQPDWAFAKNSPATAQPFSETAAVKNPLPKISVFKEMYGSVTGNLAMNILIGTALGGVVIGTDDAVLIYPTTVQGIPLTGLVFGFIVGVLVTNGIVKSMREAILAAPSDAGAMPAPDKRFSWMPKRQLPLTALACFCMMLFSSVALWCIMTLFGLSVMNFYQFTVFITIYAAVVSKPLTYVLIRRCLQPDYVAYVYKKPTVTQE